MGKVLICQYLLGDESYCRRAESTGNIKSCLHTHPHHEETSSCLHDTCSDNYCEWVNEEDIKPIIFRAMIEGKI